MRFQETVQILAELHNLGLTQERQRMMRDYFSADQLRVHNGEMALAYASLRPTMFSFLHRVQFLHPRLGLACFGSVLPNRKSAKRVCSQLQMRIK